MKADAVRRAFIALLMITRPNNVALTALSVVVGGVCAFAPFGGELAIAAVSASLIAAGGYVLNDVFDIEIDRINRPERPLPSGDIGKLAAIFWAAILVVIGVVLSMFLPRSNAVVAVIAAVSLVLYAAWLKRTLLVGNLVVAAVSGLTFLYGGFVGPAAYMALVPAVLASLFHLGREFFKAAADRVGDSAVGANTIAVKYGEDFTVRVATIPLFIVISVSTLPYFWSWFGIRYLIVVVVAVDAVLLGVIVFAWRNPNLSMAGRLARVLKWDMLAGLIALGYDRWATWISTPSW